MIALALRTFALQQRTNRVPGPLCIYVTYLYCRNLFMNKFTCACVL